VINGSIEGQLGGRAAFVWERAGLRCTIVLPRTVNLLAGLPAGSRAPGDHYNFPALSRATDARRILLVEDEALVGMLMKEMLSELDFEVLGPFANIGDAASALRADGIAAALLDVNVGGEPIYPFAFRVAERSIPLVFVTGYTAEAIDERFAHVPVLQKPIDQEALRRALSVTAAKRTEAA
jgi:CheY-like chemotaxis protein